MTMTPEQKVKVTAALAKDWYGTMLEERTNDGRRDADEGTFDPPYHGSDDPQDEDENAAYERGFQQRRKELGDAFQWR